MIIWIWLITIVWDFYLALSVFQVEAQLGYLCIAISNPKLFVLIGVVLYDLTSKSNYIIWHDVYEFYLGK